MPKTDSLSKLGTLHIASRAETDQAGADPHWKQTYTKPKVIIQQGLLDQNATRNA